MHAPSPQPSQAGSAWCGRLRGHGLGRAACRAAACLPVLLRVSCTGSRGLELRAFAQSLHARIREHCRSGFVDVRAGWGGVSHEQGVGPVNKRWRLGTQPLRYRRAEACFPLK